MRKSGQSAASAAFNAIMLLMLLMLIQHPFRALLAKEKITKEISQARYIGKASALQKFIT